MNTVSRIIKLDGLSLPSLSLFFGGFLWVISLTQVVFYTDQGVVMGYWVGATGWLGFALFQFAWYANLLELLGVLLMARYPNRAMLLAVLGVILAGQAFWFTDIPGQATNMQVIGLGAGFWFWYTSMVLVTLGVIFGSVEEEPASSTAQK
ncbi:MAG: hypothetical protein RL122_2762 [Pseudomonadota bacterium]|jgi:hypothetical protein|uniref:Transmembrane protein n=1 Tax=Thiothrix fructosivorans TaxID=111770 RepID=A0A8B0SK55_9GAMM|nr:hypothetical protein [Thiothrix fructosivorans]MBO0613086.1 hypothetical protein [Thiothrix fructosivorans]QTX11471.1 hypothetical protein J1836_003710 [Thiothrix fructosivorans]